MYSLEALFALLESEFFEDGTPGAPPPFRDQDFPPGLFSEGRDREAAHRFFDDPARPVHGIPAPEELGRAAILFHELSASAGSAFLEAWLADRPPEAALLHFARRVLGAGLAGGNAKTPEARRAAENAAGDRGDPLARTVLERACTVRRELDRMKGFLRFSPDAEGRYTARFAPDHFVLPALADHFSARFGATPWAVIDERRGLALISPGAGRPRLLPARESRPSRPGAADPDPAAPGRLWRLYHRAVNNEARSNPALQDRLLPRRYRAYLDEFSDGEP